MASPAALNLNQFVRTSSGLKSCSSTDLQQQSSDQVPMPSFYFDAFRSTSRVMKAPSPKKSTDEGMKKKKKPIRAGGERSRSARSNENDDSNVTKASIGYGQMHSDQVGVDPQMPPAEEDGESYLDILRRMKEKHMENLHLIEQMYYGDNERPSSGPGSGRITTMSSTDPDHLLSLYQTNLGAFHTTFSSSAGSKKEWTGETTKPVPFSFLKKTDDAERRKDQMGIARRRCLEYLAEVNEREEIELKKSFKANPIPRSTTEPRFQQMRDQWERRRDESKHMNAWMVQHDHDDDTFSFVRRDEERLKQRQWQTTDPEPIEVEHFHAKPIPWSVKVSLYDRLHKDNEERRKKRIAVRAASMLKKARLPQRMAIYERTKGEKKRLLRAAAAGHKQNEETHRKSHDVPDFKKLQAQFQENLDKARQCKSPTKPIGFSFTARPVKLTHRHDQEPITPKRTPRYKRDPNPPQPTKKFQEAVAYLNAKIEEKKRIEQEAAEAATKLRMDPEKRQMLAERIRAHMVDNTAELERRHEESLRQARDRDRQLARETAERLHQMQERVDRRPLLLETNGSDNCPTKRLARQKALLSVKDSLINAGISDFDLNDSHSHIYGFRSHN